MIGTWEAAEHSLSPVVNVSLQLLYSKLINIVVWWSSCLHCFFLTWRNITPWLWLLSFHNSFLSPPPPRIVSWVFAFISAPSTLLTHPSQLHHSAVKISFTVTETQTPQWTPTDVLMGDESWGLWCCQWKLAQVVMLSSIRTLITAWPLARSHTLQATRSETWGSRREWGWGDSSFITLSSDPKVCSSPMGSTASKVDPRPEAFSSLLLLPCHEMGF